MIYILILLWDWHGSAIGSIEFNDLASCKIAATEIQQQLRAKGDTPKAILCAAKGEKK